MKFERTPQFDADVRRLSQSEFELFRRVVLDDFAPACDRFQQDPAQAWPGSLRVKSITGTNGILEMTWSFAGPDGRATFQFVTVEGEPRVRWRRVGSHKIFGDP
ncbi:MAG: hypothetical protein ACR2M4_08805 [Actinomycetota bacterium]